MTPTPPKALTALQDRFAEEYIIDLNATAAASRAGYKDGNFGRQLMTNPNVAARIAELKAMRSERTAVTADRVLEELAAIGFTRFTDLASWGAESLEFVPSDELGEMAQRSVKSVKVKRTVVRGKDDYEQTTVEMELTQHDKLSALDKLAKHLNIYGEQGDPSKRSGFDGLVEAMASLRKQRGEK